MKETYYISSRISGVYFKSKDQCKRYYFGVVDLPTSAGNIKIIHKIPNGWKLCTI